MRLCLSREKFGLQPCCATERHRQFFRTVFVQTGGSGFRRRSLRHCIPLPHDSWQGGRSTSAMRDHSVLSSTVMPVHRAECRDRHSGMSVWLWNAHHKRLGPGLSMHSWTGSSRRRVSVLTRNLARRHMLIRGFESHRATVLTMEWEWFTLQLEPGTTVCAVAIGMQTGAAHLR